MTLDTDQTAAGSIATGRTWRDLPTAPPEVDDPGAIPDLHIGSASPTTTRLVEPPEVGGTTVEIPPPPASPVPAPPRPASPPPPDKPRRFMERWGWALGIGGALAVIIAVLAWAPWDDDATDAALAGVDEPVAEVAAALLPSVVQIEHGGVVGSGFAYADGRILTAAHVVAGADEVTVRTSDGQELSGTVLGGDPEADVAVVAVDEDVPPAPLSADEPQVGQMAVAIGSPLGFDQSVTSGIVSAVDRELEIPGGGTLENLIQTDAPINQGNSGGPLADRDGEVIGVNVAIASFSGGSDGLGFAVAIDEAVAIADRFSVDDPQPETLDPGSGGLPGLDDFGGGIPPELRDLLDQFLQDPGSIQPEDLGPLMDQFLDQFGGDVAPDLFDDPELRDLLDDLLQDPGAVGPEDLAPLLDDFILGDEVDPMLEDLLDLLYDNLLGE